MLRSKCKSFNSMGKVVILLLLFGINELVIFGILIVMNLYMFVLFVFGFVLVGVFNFMVLKVGLFIVELLGFLFLGVVVFLMILDWKVIVLVFVSIIFMILIYYLFFKIMEKEELNKNVELVIILDDDSFDF